jgi:hypothetical protein
VYSSAGEIVRLGAALAVLALPGLPLAALMGGPRRDPIVALGSALLLGLGCQIVGFRWLRWAPIGLRDLALVLALAGVVGASLLARRRFRLDWSGTSRGGWAAIAIFAALLGVVRMAPFALAPVAPGADMSMHTTMARLIVAADGVPTSYRPLLPIDAFGTLGTGLPSLAALATALTGVPVWRSAFFFACLAHILLALAVYALARTRTGPPGALLASVIVTAATRDPQLHFMWGGDPSVFSLAFLVAAFPLLDDPGQRPGRALPALGVLLGAAALTHAVLPYAFALVWLAVLGVRAVRSGTGAALRGLAFAACGGLAAAFLALPLLAAWHVPLSAAELDAIRHWQRLPVHVPPGHGLALLPGLAVYVVRRLGALLPVWVVAALGVRRWSGLRRAPWEEATFAGATLLLVLNALVWVLPASYVLYPDRTVTLLIVPAALLVAEAAEASSRVAPARRERLGPRLAAVGLALFLGVSLPLAVWYWYAQGLRYVAVNGDDLDVIRWIAANTPPGALIATNYGDAGVWIPAIASRPVTEPHVHFLYTDEFRAGIAGRRPRYVFVGAKRVASGGTYTLGVLERDRWDYRELYRRGAAAVFLARVPP